MSSPCLAPAIQPPLALTRETGSIEALMTRGGGEEITVLALRWVEEFQALVTPPDSGIHTVDDLGGRTILLPSSAAEGDEGRCPDIARATALRGLESTLDLGGLALQDVHTAHVPTPASGAGTAYDAELFRLQVEALRRGEGEALFVHGTAGIDVVLGEGLHVVRDLSSLPNPWHRINNFTLRVRTAQTHVLGLHEASSVDQALVIALIEQKNFLLRNGFLASDLDVDAWLDQPGSRQS